MGVGVGVEVEDVGRWISGGVEGGSVVANRVESEEYRELTSYEVFVCV